MICHRGMERRLSSVDPSFNFAMHAFADSQARCVRKLIYAFLFGSVLGARLGLTAPAHTGSEDKRCGQFPLSVMQMLNRVVISQ